MQFLPEGRVAVHEEIRKIDQLRKNRDEQRDTIEGARGLRGQCNSFSWL